MSLVLDRLLDEDYLTPAHKRAVRKLAKPALFKDNIRKQLVLTYTVSWRTEQNLRADTLKELKSLQTYKKVIFELIKGKASQVYSSKPISAQVESLVADDPLNYVKPKTLHMVKFRDLKYVLVPSPDDITAQSLFKILSIIDTKVYQNET